MGTMPAQKLLTAWKLEQMTPEMAVGHILQHLVMLTESDQEAASRRMAIHTAIEALNIGWANVKLELTELRHLVEAMNAKKSEKRNAKKGELTNANGREVAGEQGRG